MCLVVKAFRREKLIFLSPHEAVKKFREWSSNKAGKCSLNASQTSDKNSPKIQV